MRQGVTRAILLLGALVCSVWLGCGGSASYIAGACPDTPRGEHVEQLGIAALALPAGSELTIAPVRLGVQTAPAEGPESRRAQFLIRGLRRDGGVVQWFVGTDN